MLNFLSIKNIILIEEIDIDFSSGLCVLTGETGAGKSIILDSLGLVLGNRANFSLRPQNDRDTEVTAVFSDVYEDLEIKIILDQLGISHESELVLKRKLTTDGKSKSYLNDSLVSLGTLKNIGDRLVEIESQFSEQGLLNTSSHIVVLDEYGDYEDLIQNLHLSWDNFQIKKNELKKKEMLKKKVSENQELYNFYLSELSRLDPKELEYHQLLEEKKKLVNSKKIKDSSSIILNNLFSESGESVESLLVSTIKELEKIQGFTGEEVNKIIKKFDDFLLNMQDYKNILEKSCKITEGGLEELDIIEERIFEYTRLAKKHNTGEDELLKIKNKVESNLKNLEKESNELNSSRLELKEAENIFLRLANEVSEQRRKIAMKMDEQVNLELPDLKLDHAEFKTNIKKLENYSKDGMDDISFLVKTNPKSDLDHLSKISSGGELCRFALAIKVVSSKKKNNSIVFDEVDSGIGGSVASAVGEKLNRLGKKKQIIVVTHSAQVAALSDQHFKVIKTLVDGRNKTEVRKLNQRERILEIARMISGKEITVEATEAAKKLIKIK